MKKYVADFETTTTGETTRVWCYATCEIETNEILTGNNIDEFMTWCFKENKIVYFHNLKFDGEFIIHWLLKNGYTYSTIKEDKTFSCIVSAMNQFYTIEIIYKKLNKKYKKVVFYDSLKKLPFSVEKMANDFNLNLTKLEIDYHQERKENHQLTNEEIDYVSNDVKIVSECLDIQFKQGLTKMTNGSDALNDFKRTIGQKTFEKNFPILSLEIDKDIRQAYRGGFTYLNRRFANMIINGGIVYDVNSLYPSVMYHCDLPYGLPLFFIGQYNHDDLYPLYIQQLSCSFKLKDGHIPTIQLKNNLAFIPTDYIEDSQGDIVLVLTNVDLDLFLEHYHVYNINFINGWKFKSCKGIFNKYIDKWTDIKINNTGAIKQLAKLMLNSLYGKFGTNPDVTGKIPYLENDIVKWKNTEKKFRKPVYIPMGVFITSYARKITISTAQSSYDRFIYADTDSLHLTGVDTPISLLNKIDPNKLGFWKHESTFTKARFIRQKTYVEEINGKLNIVCAGMPNSVKENVTFDSFVTGFKSYGKLLPKRVSGGIILKDTEFTIK